MKKTTYKLPTGNNLKPYFRYQIQYRYNGSWTMGYTYLTKPEAENYAKQTGRDYRIVTIKG